jgi:hypothetical protein
MTSELESFKIPFCACNGSDDQSIQNPPNGRRVRKAEREKEKSIKELAAFAIGNKKSHEISQLCQAACLAEDEGCCLPCGSCLLFG